MPQPPFLWNIDAPEAAGLRVAHEIGLLEGTDFVHEGDVFRFAGLDEAMRFNRALGGEPGTGRTAPDPWRFARAALPRSGNGSVTRRGCRRDI